MSVNNIDFIQAFAKAKKLNIPSIKDLTAQKKEFEPPKKTGTQIQQETIENRAKFHLDDEDVFKKYEKSSDMAKFIQKIIDEGKTEPFHYEKCK